MVVVEVNGYTIEPGADLRGANLEGANLEVADLGGANLGGAISVSTAVKVEYWP